MHHLNPSQQPPSNQRRHITYAQERELLDIVSRYGQDGGKTGFLPFNAGWIMENAKLSSQGRVKGWRGMWAPDKEWVRWLSSRSWKFMPHGEQHRCVKGGYKRNFYLRSQNSIFNSVLKKKTERERTRNQWIQAVCSLLIDQESQDYLSFEREFLEELRLRVGQK